MDTVRLVEPHFAVPRQRLITLCTVLLMSTHSTLFPPQTTSSRVARRTVLASMLGWATMGTAFAASPGMHAPVPPRGAPESPWDTADETTRTRLLDRVTWGCTAAGAPALSGRSVAAYLTAQLQPGPAPLPQSAQSQIDAMAITRTPVEALAIAMAARQRAARALPTEDERRDALAAWQRAMSELQQETAQRFVLRALYSPAQLQEKMTWFWMNHFNLFARKGLLRAMVGDYEDRAVRPHALGRFRDLLGATVYHPAMLGYLDNAQNAAHRINENYARELMELHTLGVGGGYSQSDVQELARVLTGVGISLRPPGAEPPRIKPALLSHYVRQGLFEFNPQRHDWGTKTLLGQTLRAEGLAEVDEALDLLAQAPATARFITRKLAVFMVGDNPTPALLHTLANTFERTEGSIAAVLQVLFDTAEFQASLGQRFRDPVHYVLAGLRLAHGDTVVPSTAPVRGWLQRLAEPLYGRATPDGYPLDAASWSGSGQMNTRFEIAQALASGAGAGAPTPVREGKGNSVGNGVGSGVENRGSNGNVERGPDRMAPPEPLALQAPATSVAAPPQRLPPPLSQTPYVRALEPTWSAATRNALAQATSPREWNLLFLASPEFMHG